MLEDILNALHDEGYNTEIQNGVICVSVDEFDLYRIWIDSSIYVKSIDTGRTLNFSSYDKFLYFLES